MASERRGGWLLLLAAVATIAVAGAIVYWATHRERRSTLYIFHWVPGTGPVTILETHGVDLSATLDPKLRDLLKRNTPGGELRLVGELNTRIAKKPMAYALVLENMPSLPVTVVMFDTDVAVYVEKPAGFLVYPAEAKPGKASITLGPSKVVSQAGWFDFLIYDSHGAGSSGALQLGWW